MRRAKRLKHDQLISPLPRYDGESVDPILAFRREMVRVRLSRGCRGSIHHAAFLSLCRGKASTQSNCMNPSMSAAYRDPPFALEDNTDNRSRQTPSVTTQSLGSGSLVFSSSSLRRCKHTWGMRKPDTRDRTASSHTLSKHDTRAPKLPRYCNQPKNQMAREKVSSVVMETTQVRIFELFSTHSSLPRQPTSWLPSVPVASLPPSKPLLPRPPRVRPTVDIITMSITALNEKTDPSRKSP
ncbi:hypothetical protein CSPX01_16807 [Colletotrichum filicis]|nr:hypothetical protein CSPX01_16807 [Colletotrichum filicis]